MSRKRKELPTLEQIEITDVAAEGKALVRVDDLVVFVPWVVPGDVVDLKLWKKKHHYAEAEAIHFHKYSDKRTEPFCPHFTVCGGCKWQMLPYEEQLRWKQKQVMDALERIGKVELPQCQPILGSTKTREYRNKLEFGCANKIWLTKEQLRMKDEELRMKEENPSPLMLRIEPAPTAGAIGYHAGGSWDKILPIEECHLMDDENNRLRNDIRDYAYEHGLSFFDAREHTGLLRGMMIRLGAEGAVMLLIQFCILSDEEREQAMGLMEYLKQKHSEVTSLLWVNNTKFNDTFGDLPIEVYAGEDHIFLSMEDLRFKVGPKSFYQTNTEQAYIYVPEAIEDAKVNSEINNITNTRFYAGDMKDILTDDFIQAHGRPNVIITDPPRAGMHADVVQTILRAAPKRIVYVSCNPATQARDLQLLDVDYKVTRIQPVDMFPHTQHVENVVLLERR